MNGALALVAVLAGTLASTATRDSAPHPFHVSIATAELNQGSLEVSLRVWPLDLADALSRIEGKRVDIDAGDEVDSKIVSYLSECFVVRDPRGQESKLQWVGKEISIQEAWLYFEFPLETLDGASIDQRIFFDLHPAQVNTVNLRQGEFRNTINCHRNRPGQAIRVPTHLRGRREEARAVREARRWVKERGVPLGSAPWGSILDGISVVVLAFPTPAPADLEAGLAAAGFGVVAGVGSPAQGITWSLDYRPGAIDVRGALAALERVAPGTTETFEEVVARLTAPAIVTSYEGLDDAERETLRQAPSDLVALFDLHGPRSPDAAWDRWRQEAVKLQQLETELRLRRQQWEPFGREEAERLRGEASGAAERLRRYLGEHDADFLTPLEELLVQLRDGRTLYATRPEASTPVERDVLDAMARAIRRRLESRRDELVPRSSEGAWARARVAADDVSKVLQLERFQLENAPGLAGVRAGFLADNLRWHLGRERGPTRVVVHADVRTGARGEGDSLVDRLEGGLGEGRVLSVGLLPGSATLAASGSPLWLDLRAGAPGWFSAPRPLPGSPESDDGVLAERHDALILGVTPPRSDGGR